MGQGGSELKWRSNEVHMVLVDELSVLCLQIKGRRLAWDKELLAFSLCFYFSSSAFVFKAAVKPGMPTHSSILICSLFAVSNQLISFKTDCQAQSRSVF